MRVMVSLIGIIITVLITSKRDNIEMLLKAWLYDGMSMGSAAAFMITGLSDKDHESGRCKDRAGDAAFLLYLAFTVLFAFAGGMVVNILI